MNIQQVFAFSDAVRCVATNVNGRLALLGQRGNLVAIDTDANPVELVPGIRELLP